MIDGRLALFGALILAACGGSQVTGDTGSDALPTLPTAVPSQSGTLLETPSLGPTVDPGGLPPGARGDPTIPASSGAGDFYGPGERNYYGYN